MVFVVATIELSAGKREAFLEEFGKIVPTVQAEAGCVEYGPAVDARTDVDAQKPLGDDAVMVIEKWESLDALKAHLVAPHMQEYRERVKDIVTNTTLNILEPTPVF